MMMLLKNLVLKMNTSYFKQSSKYFFIRNYSSFKLVKTDHGLLLVSSSSPTSSYVPLFNKLLMKNTQQQQQKNIMMTRRSFSTNKSVLNNNLVSNTTFHTYSMSSILVSLSLSSSTRTSSPMSFKGNNAIQVRGAKILTHPKKFTSKRKHLPYKAKNHQGALERWMILPGGNFVRKKAGANRNGKYMRAWKRRQRRKLILATATQRKLLKKLIPYHKKAYVRRLYGGVDIFKKYKEFIRH